MKNNSGSSILVTTVPQTVLNAPDGSTGVQQNAASIPKDSLMIVSGTDDCGVVSESVWQCVAANGCTIDVGPKKLQADKVTYKCPLTSSCPQLCPL